MATKPTAATSAPSADAAADSPKPKSRRKLIFAVLLLLLLAGGGVGGWLFWQQRQHATTAKAPPPPPAPLIYLSLEPPFVANFEGGQPARFLQLDVRIASRSPETVELIRANEPLLRNDLLMLFGAQDATALANRAGKDKLRADALATVRRIVKTLGGKPETVESVLFASFVMQ